MNKYQYQLIRYIHDRVTGEFVNVGVVLYLDNLKLIKAKVITKYSRITQFYGEMDGQFLLNNLKYLERDLNYAAKQLNGLFNKFHYIDEITSSVLPKDDSSLIFSDYKDCIDILEFEDLLKDLYERYVNKYIQEPSTELQNDQYVWSKVYKKHFDKFGLTSKLQKSEVKTANDKFIFDKAIQNGSLNCFQGVSFNLQTSTSIKNKVYKWSGIINELATSETKLHLYLLSISAKKDKDLNKFITDTLTQSKNEHLKVTVVKENEADNYLNTLKKEIEQE